MNGKGIGSLTFDWKWAVAAYCYLVLFHLFPTYLFASSMIPLPRPIVMESTEIAEGLVRVWLLGGIAVVAFIVGLRSRGFTIIEPAVGGFLYAITMAFAFRSMVSPNVRDREVMAVVFWLLVVFILSVASAWIGEVVQGVREGRDKG